jgi:putative peptidoglycan lipid II flippase
MLFYVGVSQLGVYAVFWIANYAGESGGPGPAIHYNAFLLFMMVHGIVAVSILTALLPRMSAAAAENRYADVATNLSLGTRLSAVVLVPATAAYVALGVPIGVVVFQRGNFRPDDAYAIGLALMAAGVGLVPFAISQMQIFAFYAMRDTKTPALLNIPIVAAKIVFDFGVLFLVPVDYVVVGLMCGNTLSYVISVVISGRLLRKRIGSVGGGRIAQTLTRLSLASAFAGALAWGAARFIEPWGPMQWLDAFIVLAVSGPVLIIAFLAGAVFLRVREITELWATVRRRF